MAYIMKRDGKKGPSYQVRVRIPGFPDQVKSFPKLSEAKSWAQHTESSIKKGEQLNVLEGAKKHKTLDMVKRYSHLSESHTAGIVSKMNNKIFK